jgi:hypothetical protein
MEKMFEKMLERSAKRYFSQKWRASNSCRPLLRVKLAEEVIDQYTVH